MAAAATRRRTYPNTQAGWLRRTRDQLDRVLADHGHAMAWSVTRRRGSSVVNGKCRRCAGMVQVTALADTSTFIDWPAPNRLRHRLIGGYRLCEGR